MNNQKSKKFRKMHKKSIDQIANTKYKGILLRICKQRDYMFVLNIILIIVIIGLTYYSVKG